MKIRVAVFSLAFVVCLAVLNRAEGQTKISDRISLGLRASAFMPRQDEVVTGVFAGEGVVTFGLHRNAAVEMSVGHTLRYQSPRHLSARNQLTYANLSFQLRGEPTDNAGIYLGIGPSFIFNKWSSRLEGSEEFARGRDGWGAHMGAGMDWFIGENLAINLDAKYYAVYQNQYRIRHEGDQGPHYIGAGDWLFGLGMGAGLKVFF